MSGFIAVDHRVSPVETVGAQRESDASALEWSSRRRLSFLAACVVISWSVVLAPLFLLF